MHDGGPAFPARIPLEYVHEQGKEYPDFSEAGMSLRDYFAIHAPAPTKEEIQHVADMERAANPHGDTYKPARRGSLEIECSLRFKWADAMLAERKRT